MTVYTAIIELSRASWRVLRAHPRLIWFPIIALATTIATLAFVLPILVPTDEQVPWTVVVAVMFIATLIHVFFAVGLTGEALKALRGERPSITSGLATSMRHLPAIASLTAISTPIGLMLSVIGRSRSAAVRIARALIGTAWSLGTYFAIPVMVQERRSGWMSLRRSGQLFQRTWGETALSEVGIRVVTAQLSFLLLLLCILIMHLLEGSVEALLLVFGLMAAFFGVIGALEAIYRAALYVFASEGVVPDAFGGPELDAIWRAKPTDAPPPPDATPAP